MPKRTDKSAGDAKAAVTEWTTIGVLSLVVGGLTYWGFQAKEPAAELRQKKTSTVRAKVRLLEDFVSAGYAPQSLPKDGTPLAPLAKASPMEAILQFDPAGKGRGPQKVVYRFDGKGDRVLRNDRPFLEEIADFGFSYQPAGAAPEAVTSVRATWTRPGNWFRRKKEEIELPLLNVRH